MSDNLKNFSYNKIIASFHQTYNYLLSDINNDYTAKTLIDNYKKVLITMMPIIPHFANECFEQISDNKIISWPNVNEELLIEKNTNYVIQINGKKRTVINGKVDLTEDELTNQIINNIELNKYIKDKKIKKKIFVPNKLINIII